MKTMLLLMLLGVSAYAWAGAPGLALRIPPTQAPRIPLIEFESDCGGGR